MKSLLTTCFLLCLTVFAKAQALQTILDSLHRVVLLTKNDTIRMNAFKSLSGYYDDVNLDSSVYYCGRAVKIANQLQLKFDAVTFNVMSSWPLMKMGNYPQVLKLLNIGLDFFNNPANEKYIYNVPKGKSPELIRLFWLSYIHEAFGDLFNYTNNYEKAFASLKECIRIQEFLKDTVELSDSYSQISFVYFKTNKLDSALYLNQKALHFKEVITFKKYLANIYIQMGEIYKQKGDFNQAKVNFYKAVEAAIKYNNLVQRGEAHLQLADLFKFLNKIDSSLYHSKEALSVLLLTGKEKSTAIAYRIISDCYERLGSYDSSFVYLKFATLLNDKLEKAEKKKIQEFQIAGFEETLKNQELEKEKIQTQHDIRTYGMLGGLFILTVIGFILSRNNQKEKKAKNQLQEKNHIIEKTLTELKTTQAQLIQSEKLASLGELTAGIAHEIQNPLNFVNNFAEVSAEMLLEMDAELDKGDIHEAKAISADLQQNLSKINHHGQRASFIVKGMLEHSRVATSRDAINRVSTDINALADEYLRLAYHGLRAKDSSFNATIETHFDPDLPKIDVIPQDIGRVLLNLINNAFYAVNEKAKEGIEGYSSTVTVRTKKLENAIEISLQDNGNGIPESIRDKIFQPFFTTKPTGQGTGLGLSLAHDIVTKGHNGTLSVSSIPGATTTFELRLPLN
jgi:signal transduction histidine kinase